MESYKAIILTFSLRMNFLRVADIERIKSHKGEILLWINSFSMPDFTRGYGFWKDVYDGQRDRTVAETDTGHCP